MQINIKKIQQSICREGCIMVYGMSMVCLCLWNVYGRTQLQDRHSSFKHHIVAICVIMGHEKTCPCNQLKLVFIKFIFQNVNISLP